MKLVAIAAFFMLSTLAAADHAVDARTQALHTNIVLLSCKGFSVVGADYRETPVYQTSNDALLATFPSDQDSLVAASLNYFALVPLRQTIS